MVSVHPYNAQQEVTALVLKTMWDLDADGTNVVLHMKHIGKLSELDKTKKAETFLRRFARASQEKLIN